MMDFIEQATRQLLTLFPDIKAIYLFGSFAIDKATTSSDLDLALLGSSKIDSVKLWDAAQAIAIIINKDVDLIDLQQATTVFAFEIIKHSKRLYCQDNNYCDLFEMKTISMYLRFQEERKPLLEEVKRRGQIYD